MTPQEASIHLPFEDLTEIDNVFENKLFEFKQFFLQKTIIDKVFKSKLEKLKLLQTAYQVLTKNEEENSIHFEKKHLIESNVILIVFNNYEKNKNEIRLGISHSVSSYELIQNIENLLDLYNEYLQKWPEIEYNNEIFISKEKDPMELYYAIQDFSQNGGIFFEDILNSINKCPEILQNECKRLSLCRNLK